MSLNNKICGKDFFCILLLIIFSFAIFGLQPLGGNNEIYIPFMEYLKDKTLFPNDPLFQTIQYHPTLFFGLIVRLSNFFNISIKNIFVILPWLIFSFTGYIIFLISQLLFNNKNISFLLLILLMSPKFSLAFEPISINLHQITPTTFCLPFALLVIYFYLKRKWQLAFLIIGLLANVQPINAFQLTLLLTLSQITKIYLKKKPLIASIKCLLNQYLCFFLGCLPLIIFRNKSLDITDWLNTSPEWLRLIKIRTAQHFLPSTWPINIWVIFFFLGILFYFSLKYKKNKGGLNGKDYLILDLTHVFILYFLIIELLSEVIPIRMVMLLSLLRGFIFYNFFSLLYISYFIFYLLKSNIFFKKIAGIFLFCVLFLPTSALYSFSFSNKAVIGVSLFFLFAVFSVLGLKKLEVKSDKIYNFLGLLFVLFLLVSTMQRIYRNYLNWQKLTFDNSSQLEWENIQKWVNKYTSKESVFITPPQLSGFRVFSLRTIIGEYKDGANYIYHPNLLTNWWERMNALGVKDTMGQGAYLFDFQEIKMENEIRALAKSYKANYLVSTYSDLPFQKVYNNKQFSLYKLN